MSNELDINAINILPRHLKTPITEAGSVIANLSESFSILVNGDDSFFIDVIFSSMWKEDDIDGDKAEDELIEESKKYETNENIPYGIFYPFCIACAYATQALKTYNSKNKDINNEILAWKLIAQAKYWEGIAIGTISISDEININKKNRIEKAANVRHSENRAIKKTVFEYYEANKEKFKSKDDAAESIAGKIVPVKFRTVRSYIDEYHKNKK